MLYSYCIYDEKESVTIISFLQEKLKETDSIIDGDTDRLIL